jgi:hypothetical protein
MFYCLSISNRLQIRFIHNSYALEEFRNGKAIKMYSLSARKKKW